MLVPWALSLGLALATAPWVSPTDPSLWRHGSDPRVSIWIDLEYPYRRGEPVRVFASPRVDGYLTVFRIDTDGGLRVLFPREPWAETWVRGGRVVELDDAPGRSAFLVDDYPGVGYVFAITSPELTYVVRFTRTRVVSPPSDHAALAPAAKPLPST